MGKTEITVYNRWKLKQYQAEVIQAGNCCLNSRRLSFLLVNLSFPLIDRKRLQASTVLLCPAVISDFQTYASMQANDLKTDLHSLCWDLFRWSWNYLETGLYSTQVVSLRQVLHSHTAVKRLHLYPFPDSWLPLSFHLFHTRWLGLGLQLLIPLFFFSPHFWPSAMWISLKKTQQTITFSLSLSCPPFRCYIKGLPFNSQQTKSQNCKTAFQFEGISAAETQEWKEKEKRSKFLAFWCYWNMKVSSTYFCGQERK